MSIPKHSESDLETPFSIKTNQSFWEKWQIWGVGSGMGLGHLDIPESKEATETSRVTSEGLRNSEEVPINIDWIPWALRKEL